MAKDTYYFQHDYEPLSDPKLLALVGEHGSHGYGIYWRIVEMLHSDEEHKLKHERYVTIAIAKQMQTSVEQVEQVLDFALNVCKLFISDKEYFWSERVFRNLGKRDAISEKRRKAGIASAEARKNTKKQVKNATIAEQNGTHVEQKETKERKEKEIKVNIINNKKEVIETAKRFQPPTQEEVEAYITSKGYSVDAESFVAFYTSKGWMVGNNKMKDWRSAVVTWSKKDRQQKKSDYGNRHREVSCVPGDNRGSSTL